MRQPLIRQIAVEVHDEPGTPTEGRLSEVLDTLARRGLRTCAASRPPAPCRHALFAVRDGAP